MDTKALSESVFQAIFGSEIERLRTTLTELITQNGLRGNPATGFLYGGAFHTIYDVKQLAKTPKKILHPDLREQGREYVQDKAVLDRGIAEVRHALVTLLRPCATEQDFRDLLPQSVVFFLPDLASLPRTREPGWAFKDRATDLHIYENAVGTLETHLAARLI